MQRLYQAVVEVSVVYVADDALEQDELQIKALKAVQEATEVNAISLVETFEVEEVISVGYLPDEWDGNCIPFLGDDDNEKTIDEWLEELNDE